MTFRLASPFVLLLVLAAVSGAAAQGLDDPIPEPILPAGDPLALAVVADGLTAPTWGVASPVHPQQLLVIDQVGVVWRLHLDTGAVGIFADLSERLVPLGVNGPGTSDERGLLGLAFHPDYAGNGLVYTYTSEAADGAPDFTTMRPGVAPDHQSVVNEWTVPAPQDPHADIDPASRRELLRIDQPQFNHNGGALAFGPGGMLHVALGDGGNADDQGNGHVPGGNGQDAGNVLGAILRLDPMGQDAANGQYGIPPDNPFLGDSERLDEILAYGFRNPYRMSFDPRSGALWVGDVGQNDIEELNLVTAGGNHGWPVKEGSFLFDMNGAGPGFVYGESGDGPPGLIDPVVEYDHDEGIAVIGGFVYRGGAIPALAGQLVFGDFLDPDDARGRLFRWDPGAAGGPAPIREVVLDAPAGDPDLPLLLLGFGRDTAGEIYVLANANGLPSGETGVVMKLVPAMVAERGGQPPASGTEGLAARAAPNPFNPATRIGYETATACRLRIRVLDARGALVRTLLDAPVPAGEGR